MEPTPTTDPILTDNHILTRNIAATIVSKIFYLGSRLFVPPFVLMYVSLEQYGIWAYCFILISYLGMSVFGVTNVYVRYAAVFAAQHEYVKINRLVSTGLLTVSLICLAILPILWGVLPYVFTLLSIPDYLQPLAFNLMFGTILIFMADMTLGVFGYILQSLRKIVLERGIWTISFTVETFLIVAFLVMGFGIYGLLWAFVIRIMIATILYAIACYRELPSLSIRFKYFDWSMFKLFFQFGGIVQISGLLGVLNRSLEKLFAGSFIGVAAAGLYEVAEKFPILAILLPGGVNAVFLPTTAHHHAKEEHDQIREIYLKGSRFINIVTGIIMGFLAPFAPLIIQAWLGKSAQYESAPIILASFTIAYQMDVLTGPASAIYRSIQQPIKELIYAVLQLVLVIIGTLICFYWFGYTILAINLGVVSMKVLSALYYFWYSNRFLKVCNYSAIGQVLVPGLIPYVIGGILALAMSFWLPWQDFSRLSSVLLVFAAGLIYMIVCLAVIYWGVISKQERSIGKEHLKKMLNK